jgi:outer membrane murein-binding lipoprotein Lpp
MVRLNSVLCLGLALPASMAAQTAEIGQILQRLDKLEQENRDLTAQVRQLQQELGSARPSNPAAEQTAASAEERLAIQESRVEEQAQTKVESSQKFPLRITGMALFNAFLNSRYGGGAEYPTAAALTPSLTNANATLRQTIVGLEFHGPHAFLGGEVHGALAMDFFTGGVNFNSTFRLRTGSIGIDWKNTKVMVGIEKPVFNPREPSSLAQVGISPLTGAGNLWLWLPQAVIEQDFAFTQRSGLRARMAAVATHEAQPYDQPPGAVTVAPVRPGAEGRVEFYHQLDDTRRFEAAAGFHKSTTHAGGFSIPSQVFSADWFFNPHKMLDWTGEVFAGKNVSNLGAGIINQGYAIYRRGAEAITARGGWTQFTIHTLPRLDFHLFSGIQYYESAVLGTGDVSRSGLFGANLFFRLAPNVLVGPEISQFRTVYMGVGTRLANHYDFAVAYLF